jgi:hypothetical protein
VWSSPLDTAIRAACVLPQPLLHAIAHDEVRAWATGGPARGCSCLRLYQSPPRPDDRSGLSSLAYRSGGTFVPGAVTQDCTQHAHLRVMPTRGAVHSMTGASNGHRQKESNGGAQARPLRNRPCRRREGAPRAPGPITCADQAKAAARRFAGLDHVSGKVIGPIPATDGRALHVVVPIKAGKDG